MDNCRLDRLSQGNRPIRFIDPGLDRSIRLMESKKAKRNHRSFSQVIPNKDCHRLWAGLCQKKALQRTQYLRPSKGQWTQLIQLRLVADHRREAIRWRGPRRFIPVD